MDATLKGSLLDRLIDGDSPPAQSEDAAIQSLRAAIERDLTALLNARRPWRSIPAQHADLAKTIVGYGLSDFAAGAMNAAERRETLRRDIELTVQRFEPRLSSVSVVLLGSSYGVERLLRLRIEAVLRVAPGQGPIRFETLLDATAAELVMKAS